MTKDDVIVWVYNNDKIKKYSKSICPNDNWEELISELIIQLYKMSLEKLMMIYQMKYLEYVCFTILKRILYGNISGSGIFYKKNKLDEIDINGWEGDFWWNDYEFIKLDCWKRNVNFQPDHSKMDNERIEKILELVEGSHYYQKTLFKEYYINGLKLREISEKYGINSKSIHYTINKFRIELKKKLMDD